MNETEIWGVNTGRGVKLSAFSFRGIGMPGLFRRLENWMGPSYSGVTYTVGGGIHFYMAGGTGTPGWKSRSNAPFRDITGLDALLGGVGNMDINIPGSFSGYAPFSFPNTSQKMAEVSNQGANLYKSVQDYQNREGYIRVSPNNYSRDSIKNGKITNRSFNYKGKWQSWYGYNGPQN